jgi:SulP family sulfate permease
LKQWRSALVLAATFGLTIVHDLTAGIVAGCALAALFALLRRPLAEEGA